MSQLPSGSGDFHCRLPKVVGERVALQLHMADVSIDELKSYSQFLSAKFQVTVKFKDAHMVQIEGRFERLGELRKFIAQNALKKYAAGGNLPLKPPTSPIRPAFHPMPRPIPDLHCSSAATADQFGSQQLQKSFAEMNTFDQADDFGPDVISSPMRKRKRDLIADPSEIDAISVGGTFLCEICNKSFWTSQHLSMHRQTHTAKKRKPDETHADMNVFGHSRRSASYADHVGSSQDPRPSHSTGTDSHIRHWSLMES